MISGSQTTASFMPLLSRNRRNHESERTSHAIPVPVPLPLAIPLVLASQSPRRRELLATAGIPFTVRVADVEEIRAPGEPPDAYARRLARAKAEAAWQNRSEIVLGADTVVVLDNVLEQS